MAELTNALTTFDEVGAVPDLMRTRDLIERRSVPDRG